jgi:hypothetical protein
MDSTLFYFLAVCKKKPSARKIRIKGNKIANGPAGVGGGVNDPFWNDS